MLMRSILKVDRGSHRCHAYRSRDIFDQLRCHIDRSRFRWNNITRCYRERSSHDERDVGEGTFALHHRISVRYIPRPTYALKCLLRPIFRLGKSLLCTAIMRLPLNSNKLEAHRHRPLHQSPLGGTAPPFSLEACCRAEGFSVSPVAAEAAAHCPRRPRPASVRPRLWSYLSSPSLPLWSG